MKLRSCLLDDDIDKRVLAFQEYMNKDSRIPMNYSRTLNFLLDLALLKWENEHKLESEVVTNE